MRKWIITLTIFGAMLLLVGCGASTSALLLEVADDGSSATVTAENAEADTSTFGGTLVVNEGDCVEIAADFEEEGEMRVTLISEEYVGEDVDLETMEGVIATQDYALNEAVRGTMSESYAVSTGKYYVGVEAGEKLNGTAEIRVISAGKTETDDAEADAEDGQNPVMNFIGPYVCDRAKMLIEADGDSGAKVTVTWGGSASETAQWEMTGPFDTDELRIEYHDCVKKDITYDEDGNEKSSEEVYTGGHGFIFFGENGTLTWQDDIEHVADNMTFEFDADAQ